MDYRIFANEGNFDTGQMINEYISGGQTSLDDAMKMNYWPWETDEVAEMLKWMREFNQNPQNERKIKFYGFDMQTNGINKFSKTQILQYIDKVNDQKLNTYREVFDGFNDNRVELLPEIKNEEAIAIIELLEKNKDIFIEKTSKEEFEMFKQYVEIMKQSIEIQSINFRDEFQKGFETRDYYMAKNIEWILEYEKQFNNDKIMLWAHNGHISKSFQIANMGEKLHERFGQDYYAIGFDFDEGFFRIFAGSKVGKQAVYGMDNTFASTLNSVGLEKFYIDFNMVEENTETHHFISEKQKIRFIGAVIVDREEDRFEEVEPIKAYNGIIYIRKTNAAKPFKS